MLARTCNPKLAKFNQKIAGSAAHLLVTFRPDGTCAFSVVRDGPPARNETSTYFIKNNMLFAQSPATKEGSSFDHQLR